MNKKLQKIGYKKYFQYANDRLNPKKKIIILFFLLSINIILFLLHFKKYKKISNFDNNLEHKNSIILDYNNNSFAIIRRLDCRLCGLFSYYNVYLGCINKFINLGYIPIIDLESFPNIFNKMNSSLSSINPWEYYFNQPFGYTLENVKNMAKKVYYFECSSRNYMPRNDIFHNITIMNFWHNISKVYIPIKSEILIEANNIIKRLFKHSKNILGILVRGTDYLALKPKSHPIPPKPEKVIDDIKKLDKKNNYDFFFISTEDDILRKLFIKEFNYKIKYLAYYRNINYKYKKPQFLGLNKNILGNIEYSKVYLLNMIILSKCIDIISAQTSGSIGIFILTNGFRYSKIYNLGNY